MSKFKRIRAWRTTSTRLLRPIIAHRWLITIGLVFLFGGALVNLSLPALLKYFVDQISSGTLSQYPYWFGMVAIMVFAVQGLCFYFRSLAFGIIGQRVAHQLRLDCFSALVHKPIEFFDRNRVGDLQSRLSADINAIQDAISVRLSVVLRYGFQVLLGIALMVRLSWRLSSVLLIGMLGLVFLSFIIARRLRSVSRQQSAQVGAASSLLGETLGGIRVVQGFNRQELLASSFADVATQALVLGEERSRISAFFQSFVSFLLNSSLVALAIFGLVLVAQAQLSAGDMAAFLSYGAIIAVSFSFLISGVAEISQSLGAAERAFALLEQPDSAQKVSSSALQLNKIGTVEFKNVDFAYPIRPEQLVLKNLSLSVKEGERVGLVGSSGAGKSTVMALLLKFYSVQRGEILFEGKNIDQIDTVALRDKIAFVPQEAQIFGLSLRENLLIGNPAASEQQLTEALKQSNLSDVISKLPQGLDTLLGDRGVQLSGGQRQRVAIARALLKAPELLLLDEATASLDSENETLVHEAMMQALKGRSAIIIAHRLSTVQSCDKIMVLDAGQVVEEGSHDALMAIPNGLYQQLVKRQKLG